MLGCINRSTESRFEEGIVPLCSTLFPWNAAGHQNYHHTVRTSSLGRTWNRLIEGQQIVRGLERKSKEQWVQELGMFNLEETNNPIHTKGSAGRICILLCWLLKKHHKGGTGSWHASRKTWAFPCAPAEWWMPTKAGKPGVRMKGVEEGRERGEQGWRGLNGQEMRQGGWIRRRWDQNWQYTINTGALPRPDPSAWINTDLRQ